MTYMICSKISKLLGVVCHPLNDDGSVVMLETPFAFDDGDQVPLFLERIGPHLRFFDDGKTILHFHGRGIFMESARKLRFIRSAAETNGVSLSDRGVLEIWTTESDAPEAFARYVSTMTQLTSWERDQTGLSTDTTLLIAEVAQCLKAWKPNAHLVERPSYTGVSGLEYQLDFDLDGEGVIAISPHHVAVSAAIKKLLDIKSRPEHSELRVMAIIDDRQDMKAAKREGLIMDALASVWMMSRLEERAGLKPRAH